MKKKEIKKDMRKLKGESPSWRRKLTLLEKIAEKVKEKRIN